MSLNKEFFRNNRKRLRALLPENSVALVFSNSQIPRNANQFFPYRQNSNLLYLCGIDQEETILLMAPDHPENEFKEILFIQDTSPEKEIWEGKKLTFDQAKEISGIDNIKTTSSFFNVLHKVIIRSEKIYVDIPEFPRLISTIPTPYHPIVKTLKDLYPLCTFERLSPIINKLRIIKTPEEIEIIKKACKITTETFRKVLENVKPGMYEFEIEALITYEFIKNRSTGHSYLPIVASGINGCYLHYNKNDKILEDGELLLLDFGAEYDYYASDLSRTIPVNGKFSEKQKKFYNATLNVFREIKKNIKPGTSINELNSLTLQLWKEEHVKLGLYSENDFKDKGESIIKKYFPHGISHFLGLDVHDVGFKDEILKSGMIITLEPGIYVMEDSMGIRIENDILITDDGNIDLMDNAPIDIEEIEYLMNK